MNKMFYYVATIGLAFYAGSAMATTYSAAAYANLAEEEKALCVASVGTNKAVANYYTTLQEAFAALQKATNTANYRLTLLSDVESTALSFTGTSPTRAISTSGNDGRTEQYIVDLNNHSITVADSDGYALTVNGTSDQSIIGVYGPGAIVASGTTLGAVKFNDAGVDRVVNVTMTSENADNATCCFGTKVMNGLVKGCTVTNTKGDAVAVYGHQGFVHTSTVSAKGTALYVKQEQNATGGFACSASNITGEVAAINVDVPEENLNYPAYITGGVIHGDMIDDGMNLWVCGGTFDSWVAPESFSGSGYGVRDNGDGTSTIIDSAAVLVDDAPFADGIQKAFDMTTAAKDAVRKITLRGDIFLLALEAKTVLSTLSNNQKLVIDLNGYDLNVFDVTASITKSFSCFQLNENSQITIVDNSVKQTGYMSFASWTLDRRNIPGYGNYMFNVQASNQGGVTLEGGSLENLTYYRAGWEIASYIVNLQSNSFFTMNGGSLESQGTAIRLCYGNSTFNLHGGSVHGAYAGFWMQNPYSQTVLMDGGNLSSESYCFYSSVDTADKSEVATKLEISGGVISGTVSCGAAAKMTPGWAKITGGTFIDPNDDGFYLYGMSNTLVVSGGEFDRGYMKWFNYMRLKPNDEDYYLKVVQTPKNMLMINNGGRYTFGDPAACVTCQYLWYGDTIYTCNAGSQYMSTASTYYSYDSDNGSYILDRYESLTAALKDCGQEMQVCKGMFWLIGQNVKLLKDDTQSVAGYYYNYSGEYNVSQLVETRVDLSGYAVESDEAQSLIKVYARGLPPTLKVVGGGSITSGGKIFEIATQGTVEIHDGDYTTTNANGLLFANKGDYKVKVVADVGDGSYFDVNPASFSHDVSSFVYNAPNAIEFKTLQATAVDNRWYLGRNVEVVKEQN